MAEPSSFAGKVAVVTGAAQGVGEATARLMAARGAAGLALIDR
jgi:benzoate/toluate 1,2-dioxygenase reductase subunit